MASVPPFLPVLCMVITLAPTLVLEKSFPVRCLLLAPGNGHILCPVCRRPGPLTTTVALSGPRKHHSELVIIFDKMLHCFLWSKRCSVPHSCRKSFPFYVTVASGLQCALCPSSDPALWFAVALWLFFALNFYIVRFPLLSYSTQEMEVPSWLMLAMCHALVVDLALTGLRSLWGQEPWITLGRASDLVRHLNETCEWRLDLSTVDIN